MILSQTQANTIYNAMCVLNNAGMRLDAFRDLGAVHAREMPSGLIVIHAHGQEMETYDNQQAFAVAYGLQ